VRFYEPLLHAFEMRTIVKTPEMFYCVGSRTGVAISPADRALRAERFSCSRTPTGSASR
jgi:hypothetical protein